MVSDLRQDWSFLHNQNKPNRTNNFQEIITAQVTCTMFPSMLMPIRWGSELYSGQQSMREDLLVSEREAEGTIL